MSEQYGTPQVQGGVMGGQENSNGVVVSERGNNLREYMTQENRNEQGGVDKIEDVLAYEIHTTPLGAERIRRNLGMG